MKKSMKVILPILLIVILTSFSGCGNAISEASLANDTNITPTQAIPTITEPTDTIEVITPTNVTELTPTATPTVTTDNMDELRGVSNGNAISGVDTLYKGLVYTVMVDYDTAGYGVYSTTMEGEIIHNLYKGFAHSLNVYKDKVYFLGDDKNPNVFRCNLDGSALETIVNKYMDNMIIYNDWIYAINEENEKLVRFHLDGSHWEEISETECIEFIIEQSKIYFSSYFELYSINLDGSDKQQLYEDGSFSQLNYSDGWLYFLLEEDISKLKTDGTEYEILREGNVFNINVDDEYIYFIDIKKDRELRRMKKDGSEEIRLDEPRAYSISILGDYIRYIYGLDENHAIYQMKKDGSEKKLIRNDISQRYE